MSLGTRCHQLAMYVVYESPLQMLADAPTNYEREPESMEFLAAVPTVWDETRVLDAQIGDYVAVARRRGQRLVRRRDDGLDAARAGRSTCRSCPRERFALDAYQDGAERGPAGERLPAREAGRHGVHEAHREARARGRLGGADHPEAIGAMKTEYGPA